MTKSELIARLAERNPRLVARDADEAVNTMLDTMTEALSTGQRIEIRGFGSFALNYRPPRVGRNPKSGDRVQVPASTSLISRQVKNCGSALTARGDQLQLGWERRGRRVASACIKGSRFLAAFFVCIPYNEVCVNGRGSPHEARLVVVEVDFFCWCCGSR